MTHRLLLTTASLLALLGTGCTAQSVTAPIDGEPVCPDFRLGVTKTLHKGSLRQPVRVQVLEDDDEARFLHGKIASAHFFVHQVLPRVLARQASIQSEDRSALTVVL